MVRTLDGAEYLGMSRGVPQKAAHAQMTTELRELVGQFEVGFTGHGSHRVAVGVMETQARGNTT